MEKTYLESNNPLRAPRSPVGLSPPTDGSKSGVKSLATAGDDVEGDNVADGDDTGMVDAGPDMSGR